MRGFGSHGIYYMNCSALVFSKCHGLWSIKFRHRSYLVHLLEIAISGENVNVEGLLWFPNGS